MKLLSTYKIDNEHKLKVFENGSQSNYNRFIAIFRNGERNPLWGTTEKETTTKEQLIDRVKGILKL